MAHCETRTSHRYQLFAVSIAMAFFVSACGGGGGDADGGGTGIVSTPVAQPDPAPTSSGTTSSGTTPAPALPPPHLTDASAPTSCNYSPWVQGTIYEAGSIVNYSGSLYIARVSNAGSVPTPNANGRSDWAPYDCSNPAPALVVQPASRVNTTTAGEQKFASVSAQTNGGYTVSWIDNNMAFAIQRYDNAGGKVGTQVSVPFSTLTTTGEINRTSVVVLRDGSVVFVYETSRLRAGSTQTDEGIFFQRFDSRGVQLSGETPVVSPIAWGGSSLPGGAGGRAVALADGGFVVTWISLSQSPQFLRNTLFKQRYDSQAQAVGGNVAVTEYLVPGFGGSYALVADMEGGYTLTLFPILDRSPFIPFTRSVGTYVIHYDAADTAREIVAQRLGSALLLPLAGDRFVLFTSDSAGTVRQFLDSAGISVGPATSVASMPSAATELADRGFVLFLQASGGGFTAQRFAASGAALGDAVPVDAIVTAQGVAALNGGGLALGWSATPPGGDLDVFTERVLVRN